MTIHRFGCIRCNDAASAPVGIRGAECRDATGGSGGGGSSGAGRGGGVAASGAGGVRGDVDGLAPAAGEPAAGRVDDRGAGSDDAPVPGVHRRVSVAVGPRGRRGVDGVAAVGGSVTFNDPLLPELVGDVHGVHLRSPLPLGERVRGPLRGAPGADLPRVEHRRSRRRLRGRPGSTPVHPRRAAGVLRSHRRRGRASRSGTAARVRWRRGGTPPCSR